MEVKGGAGGQGLDLGGEGGWWLNALFLWDSTKKNLAKQGLFFDFL